MTDQLADSPAETEAATPGGGDEYEDLRAEVRQIAASEGKSIATLATEAGIANGTFSPWLGGKYPGRQDRIAEKVRSWLAARQVGRARRASLPAAPAMVMTPTADAIIGTLEHAQHAPDLVVISGGAGVGKTMSATLYAKRTPNVWYLAAEPCSSTVRVLLDDIAEMLGIGDQRSTPKVSRAIAARLRGTGGLLIIDEAQHLSSHSLDQLRTLHDKAEVGVALIGNESVYSRIEGHARSSDFAQLFSRVGMRLPRPRPTRRDVEMLLDAWGIADGDTRKLLHVIAGKPGALRGLTKCLRIAHMQAAADGADGVSERYIRLAWQHLAAATVGDVERSSHARGERA